MVGNDSTNSLGMGAWQGDFATKSYVGIAPTLGTTSTYQFSVNGGAAISVQVRSDSVANASD